MPHVQAYILPFALKMNFKFNVALSSLTLYVMTPVWPVETDTIYSVSILYKKSLFQPERQIFCLFNMGRYFEYAKVHVKMLKNRLSLQTSPVLITLTLFYDK